ncbi:M20 metallopeptidase family protein [Bythopirellula polymerisocia]|uniref:Putative hydrolase YxeP n=1 Tax=Bythopirellula polymerisocia TaxID=2528003 RepID=A0A5C6CQ75_9BACT|nr:amidohydrolase [Bythopirellula polymerisocia]TWU25571.1 putative hydrolase YxeP [Bythopirellula polymerisocia]
MPEPWKQRLDAIISEKRDEVRDLRRHLHAFPEPSGAELATSMHLYQLLGQLGVDVQMGPEGCGVIADSLAPKDKTLGRIAVRGDIDALQIQDEKTTPYRSTHPGIMHACGHDAHSAIAYGVVQALVALTESGELPWPICWRVIFQPAEETAAGAAQMIEMDVLADVEKIFALHVDPTRRTGEIALRSGPMTASCDSVQLTITGRGGHAARPHESRDPIAAAAQVISSLYQFVPRATDTHDAVVLTFGSIQGGTNPNIIPDHVELHGTMRTLDSRVRTRTIEQIQQVIRGVEGITGTKIEFTLDASIPSVVNDANSTALLWQAAEEVIGAKNVQLITRPSMGSEDFACYLEQVPGAMFRLGSAADLAAITPLHTPKFDIDEGALEIGVRVLARSVVAACATNATSNQSA